MINKKSTALDPITKNPWIWQITALSILLGMLGVLMVSAIGSQRRAEKAGVPGGGYAGLMAAYEDLKTVNTSYRGEIRSLQLKVSKYEGVISGGSGAVSALHTELNDTRFLAGLTSVSGPGVIVTLKDSPNPPKNAPAEEIEQYMIHDYDIRNIVNELKAAGAETVAVNDQRVIATTAIRCVGPAIQVNGIPVNSPFVIRATGEPNVLETGLKLPGGILAEFEQVDRRMVTIQKSKNLNLPAYSGSTHFSYTKPGR